MQKERGMGFHKNEHERNKKSRSRFPKVWSRDTLFDSLTSFSHTSIGEKCESRYELFYRWRASKKDHVEALVAITRNSDELLHLAGHLVKMTRKRKPHESRFFTDLNGKPYPKD